MSELVKKSINISRASTAWRYLNGVINVYKPAGFDTRTVVNALKTNLCKDLNSMQLEDPKPLVQIDRDDNDKYSINLVPNLSRHILATGPLYTRDLIKISAADMHGVHTSGVMVLGINRGIRIANRLRNGAPIQTFHVTGKFGKATETNFQGDRVTNRATYKHVTKGKLQALVSSVQATYQKEMYALCGLDIQSQEAYELACKGLIRPKNTQSAVIYGMKCIEFTGNTFTIEFQTMNASERLLAEIISDVALQLRTVAHCTKIRCTRFGYFTFEDSLLRSHWNLQNVLQSMHECELIWKKYPNMVSEEVASPVGYEQNLAIQADPL